MFPSDRELIGRLGAVGRAFLGTFDELREVQRLAIPAVMEGRSVLLASATASGKTEALMAPLMARLLARAGGQGVRLLAVAPTRALVNDLYRRIEPPLTYLGQGCGRQTSDHRDKQQRPEVLVTTPESLDSMLVRDGTRRQGQLTGHLLAQVQAVLVDEAHLFEASPRGDHLLWLLARLRGLRRHGHEQGWSLTGDLQACAASATVSDPSGLARRLLGPEAMAIEAPGRRDMALLALDPPRWVPLEALGSLEDITTGVIRAAGPHDLASITDALWAALSLEEPHRARKILVFVPSRSLCDRLSTMLATNLGQRRHIIVAGHHGSLERASRERAEAAFVRHRDAVLVATTTLEVGIDIGDVDAVALVGSPPDTASLLQRVGRSGRRSGCARIIPIARDEVEARAFASMIDSASRGALDPSPAGAGRRWSILVQQAASTIAQTGRRGRMRADLEHLASQVWPENERPSTASRILDGLVADGVLVSHRDRLFLGEILSDRLERGGGGLHSNFETDGAGLPVVDSSTGEIIARVASPPEGQQVALAGRSWEVLCSKGEILLRPDQRGQAAGAFRYATRPAPCRRSLAEHVRRGLGLPPEAAPVLDLGEAPLWFHFGGAAFELVIRGLLPSLKPGLMGLALTGEPTERELRTLASHPQRLRQAVEELAPALASLLAPGRYHSLLPPDVQAAVIVDLLDIQAFGLWLDTRKVRGNNNRSSTLWRLIDSEGK